MMMGALQVAGGVGCCPPRLPAGRQRLAVAARAVASTTTTVEEEEGKVRLGESSVAVTKLGIGAWSWGDTTYWNDSEWDGTYVSERVASQIPGHASRAFPAGGEHACLGFKQDEIIIFVSLVSLVSPL